MVFDGWKTGERNERQVGIAGVRVIYSRIGEPADAVIKRIVSMERRQWIVVSSDRDIARHAWAVDSVPVGTDDFLRFLTRTESDCALDSDEDQMDDLPSRKGNPRRLSRKEKAVERALKKL